jgi:hypothetical protein
MLRWLFVTVAVIVGNAAASAQDIAPLQQRCASFGYQPGTPAFARCVQREYSAEAAKPRCSGLPHLPGTPEPLCQDLNIIGNNKQRGQRVTPTSHAADADHDLFAGGVAVALPQQLISPLTIRRNDLAAHRWWSGMTDGLHLMGSESRC